ncbi:NAC domain-containing protein [Citrus sinensis]|uniref:NAC domain-containing protein 19-like n=1 Tax=Citrus sinensis TaxID=2711 RepID=UPI000CC402E3|nr:NAC domain-containing protein 19-like [Citrus sinensis]KAH9706462.1 NAC domain-containing protein [Citrus sinensis]GAY50708.1 hypothetical protein CUMW_128810 [Citrus unshiu]
MQEHRPFLPHGFQFRPSDEELIELYLKKKVSGIFIPLAEYFIRDCNLYEEKPSEIWNSHGGPFLNADEDLYFFTQLKKKSSKGSRIDRKVGSSGGSWQGEDAGKDIVSGQSKIKIGSKKRFRYEKKGCEDHGAWIMHEYTLHLPKNQATNYVLCRLRKNQPTGHGIMKYGSAKKRKLKDFQDNSNQSEQVAVIEMDRLLTHQQNKQQNYMDYQEVSCSSSDMMSEQSLAGGMGLASSVTEQHSVIDDHMQQQQSRQISVPNLEFYYGPSMEMMMSHFDQMICNQQSDSGNNMLQGRETGENYHCYSESIVEVPMAVPESLVQHEDSDGLPELIEEDYSFLEDLLHDDAEEPIGDVRGSFGLMLDLDDLLS